MVMREREIGAYIEEALTKLAEASAYSGKSDAARERHFEAIGAARLKLETALLLTKRRAA
jgi:hypothetical protein